MMNRIPAAALLCAGLITGFGLAGAAGAQAMAGTEARSVPSTTEVAEALPEGDDPRARFIRQCVNDNNQIGICTCLTEALLEKLDPLELTLIMDMSGAKGNGEEAIRELAAERGMSVREAKQAVARITGRMRTAMMSVDPMACARNMQ